MNSFTKKLIGFSALALIVNSIVSPISFANKPIYVNAPNPVYYQPQLSEYYELEDNNENEAGEFDDSAIEYDASDDTDNITDLNDESNDYAVYDENEETDPNEETEIDEQSDEQVCSYEVDATTATDNSEEADCGYEDEQSELIEAIEAAKDIPAFELIQRFMAHDVPVDTLISVFSNLVEDVTEQIEDTTDVVEVDENDELTEEDISEYADEINEQVNRSNRNEETLVALLEQLSLLYEKVSNYHKVVELQERVIETDAYNEDALERLTNAYEQLGDQDFKMYINGKSFDSNPIFQKGRTLVPFRSISETMNAEVNWNNKEQSVSMSRGENSVKLYIGKTTAYVNQKPVKLEIPAQVVKGSTVVPLRFISEALDADVKWQPSVRLVYILDRQL